MRTPTEQSITSKSGCASSAKKEKRVLEHLITADPSKFVPELMSEPPKSFIPEQKAAPNDLVDAKMRTAQLLESLQVPSDTETSREAQKSAAQRAFQALTLSTDTQKQREALEKVETPDTVKHLVGMLTAYDWAFVEQAQEIRGYTVSGIMKETLHHDAKVRLKAFELLGKVTEIALFTERIEVTHKQISDEELEQQLRAKLEKFVGAGKAWPTDVEDAVPINHDEGKP